MTSELLSQGSEMFVLCGMWGGSLGQVPDTGLVLNRSGVVKKTSFTKEKIGSMQIETSLHNIKGVMLSPRCVTELTHSPVLLPGSACPQRKYTDVSDYFIGALKCIARDREIIWGISNVIRNSV